MISTCSRIIIGILKHYRVMAIMLISFLSFYQSLGQINPSQYDTLLVDSATISTSNTVATNNTDSLYVDSIKADSTLSSMDTTSEDAKIKNKETQLGIKISKDALDTKVTSIARDSLVIDVQKNVYDMYGDVEVKYGELDLKGGKINYQQKTNIITASPERDTTNRIISFQEFAQGTEKFTYDSLQYNFVSKRAIVKNAKSQYGEGYVHSEQVKRNADESIFGYKNSYTTCDLDTPHFAIRARKIKVVPGKIIASGPANLELQNVPTPLFLPFGIFPISDKQRSGFILPSYTIEEQRGLGLQRGGYYFAVSDHLGVTTQFDIFSKGSWGFLGRADYAKRYHYNGNLQIGYNYTKTGETYDPTSSISRDFNITLNHQQDGKARPGTNFGASINIATRNYNKLNGVDALQMLNNSFNSSISYSKNWIGKPYSFTAALRHSQNTQSGKVSVTLPELNFAVSQLTPFQRKNQIGIPKWYEKITATYNIRAVNNWDFIDSTFKFSTINLSDFNNAIVQDVTVSAAYNIFRFVNLSFNIPYTEYWNTKQIYRYYDTAGDATDTTINNGFFTSRSFSLSTSLSTRLYGTMLFKKGKIKGIRHVLTPNVGFRYQPGFANDPYNYFYWTQLGSDYPYQYESPYISPYAPYGGPSNSLPNGSITFGIQNNLQMKVGSKDSTGSKNISLLDAFSINSSYNLFADSCNFAPFNVQALTSIFKVFKLSGVAIFDPYKYVRGLRTKDYLANTGGGLLDFRSARLAFGFTYQGQKQNEEQQKDSVNSNDQVSRLLGNGGIDDYYDFNIPWNISIDYSLDANKRYYSTRQIDSIAVTHSLMLSGGFNLTQRWQVNLQSGYNFTDREIGLTSINISRDLHCWQMSLNLVPFGRYRSFNFLLQVKSAVLQDLKLIRRKSYLDNF